MAKRFDYNRMQTTATRLLDQFQQGVVLLKRLNPGVPNPAEPWKDVAPGDPTIIPLKAVVKRLHQRYEGGALIVETGDMVTCAVPSTAPLNSDLLVIDGQDRVITNLTPIPAAGTPVAWKAWCAV